MNTRASRCAIWRLHAPPSRYERIQPQAKERTAKLPPNRVTFLNGPNRDFPKWRRQSLLLGSKPILRVSRPEVADVAARAPCSRSVGKDFRLSFGDVWNLSKVPNCLGNPSSGGLSIWFNP